MEGNCSIGVFDKKDGMESNFEFGDNNKKYSCIFNNGRTYSTMDKAQNGRQS